MQIKIFNKLAEALKSAAHPERIAIIKLICDSVEKRLTVKKIYETMGIEQSVVSRHLGILRHAGILDKKMEGRYTYYGITKNNKIAESIYKCLNRK